MTERNIGLTAATTASRTALAVIAVDPLTGQPLGVATPTAVSQAGAGYPLTATPVSACAVVANSEANPSMPAVAGKTNYLAGFSITGGGATGAALITANLQNAINNGIANASWIIAVPAGVLLGIEPLTVTFDPPLPATAANTALNITVPAFGAGNTKVAVTMWGFVL